jgi:hypothetical protein
MHHFRIRLIAAALLVLATSCGEDKASDTGELPVNNGDSGTVDVDGACLAEEPDCGDMVGIPDDGQDLPGDSGESSGMTIDGGLTIADALTRGPADGTIAVQGIFFRDEDGAFLCDVIAESFPPLCGEPRVALEGSVDSAISAPVQSEQGVDWTNQAVTVFGTMDEGVLTVDALTTG